MIKKRIICLSLGLFLGFLYGWGQQSSVLSGLKSKKLKILEVTAISDSSLPENVVVEIPVSISLHGNGDIFVCDGKAADVKRFDAAGKFLGTIGRKGQGPGEFFAPSMVHVSENYLVVWDRSTRKLSLLTRAGRFLKALPFAQAREGYPTQIRSLSDGKFVIETERVNYQDERYPQECLICLHSSQMEFIKTLYARPVFRFKPIYDPGYAEVHQPYNPRVYWDVTPGGKVVIGFSDKYEIEIHDPEKGKLQTLSGNYVPVKVTEDDKEEYFSAMNVSFVTKDGQRTTKKGAPAYIINNTLFPRYKPAFNSLRADSEGNIWVHTYRESREEEKRTFDAFSDRGEYIGKIEILPPGEYPRSGTTIRDGCFWKIESDKDGMNKITKYKIS
ncbi:MAG: 6-bladed beta-propeller [Candidatus Aminicenantes bacterium]|nr:6-bladed beta-propeller [Candidatus Aminicenantes bacterium]